jgi:hypothetical protein
MGRRTDHDPGVKLRLERKQKGVAAVRKKASGSVAGYSGTPLAAKLGFKPGLRIAALGAPKGYLDLLAPLPDGVAISTRASARLDGVHLFSDRRAALAKSLPALMRAIAPDGFLWVSWPKKTSGVPTDVTEDVIRELALPLGLVDVKVCAVDATWSGLKLVIRKELRKG